MERVVQVWDRPYRVVVDRRSKSVWIASGDYEGRIIETKGRSASSALALWRDAARYAGNL